MSAENTSQQPHDALFLITNDETHQTFMVARASAIERYADIEQILASLCAYLMGVTVDIAGIPFFRMNNARARLAMLKRLLKKKHGDTYNNFWNSLAKELKPIDDKRNLIVHWITEKTVTSNNERWSCLVGANYWDRTENSEKIYLNDIYEFILRCHFFYHLIQNFLWVISESPKKIHASWPEICQQPVVYPPLNTHPLYRQKGSVPFYPQLGY